MSARDRADNPARNGARDKHRGAGQDCIVETVYWRLDTVYCIVQSAVYSVRSLCERLSPLARRLQCSSQLNAAHKSTLVGPRASSSAADAVHWRVSYCPARKWQQVSAGRRAAEEAESGLLLDRAPLFPGAN